MTATWTCGVPRTPTPHHFSSTKSPFLTTTLSSYSIASTSLSSDSTILHYLKIPSSLDSHPRCTLALSSAWSFPFLFLILLFAGCCSVLHLSSWCFYIWAWVWRGRWHKFLKKSGSSRKWLLGWIRGDTSICGTWLKRAGCKYIRIIISWIIINLK